jgi:hypothetical protein
VAEINEDPDEKKEFDVQMLAMMDLVGQLSLPKRISPPFFLQQLRCISLATAVLFFYKTHLPTDLSAEWSPFQFLNCDVRGGDVDEIEGADTTKAFVQGQYPLVDGRDPNFVFSVSWPKYMEAQDLYPVAASTYTWANGIKVEVPCSAQEKEVKIERTECPDSFVNPIDLNHGSPCVKVLH